jgi:hypothetical protein
MLSEPTTAAEVIARARQTAAWRKSIQPARPRVQPKSEPVVEVKQEPVKAIIPDPLEPYRSIPWSPDFAAFWWVTKATIKNADSRSAWAVWMKMLSGEQERVAPPPDKVLITRDAVLTAVCMEFGISKSLITSASRIYRHTLPRQVFMYLARELTPASTLQIGKTVNRDHSTAVASYEKIADLITRDMILRERIENITRMLGETYGRLR